MDKFERLNYETQQWRNSFVTRPANTNTTGQYSFYNGASDYWANYNNNQVYKNNNGAFSRKYY